ncbi:hypothetical protein Tco_0789762, partial [Tanacetum coccineum]
FIRIVDLIDLPNVIHDNLRVVIFPISLTGDGWRWFDGIKGSITSWVDLTAKFFEKFYPPSRTGKVNTPIIKWDPTNPKFKNWLASKFVYYKTMDIFTKGALSDYWKLGNPDLLTKDIEGFKTYDEYKDDWIYEWNENVPWVHEKPWTDIGVWTEPALVVHYCNHLIIKVGIHSGLPIAGKKNGISHPYQKLKGFYNRVLNLGPDYIRDAKTEEWLTRGHISVHEMEW